LQNNIGINSRGHLEAGGCDLTELARQFATPLYVLDEKTVRANCRAYLDGLASYPGKTAVHYAGKAFLAAALCRILEQEGFGLDVVSGGELYTALTAGFPAAAISFNGNNKSAEELDYALTAGIGRFIVDNIQELTMLDALARKKKKTADILLRIAPGVETHTHSYVQTGQVDSKFGLTLTEGYALAAGRKALSLGNIRLRGLHCHIGSQIFAPEPYAVAVGALLDLARQLQVETGWQMEEINLGGGLGIHYAGADAPPSIAEYTAFLTGTVQAEAERRQMELPALILEPGRSIVGPAGITLYTVGASKTIPGIRKYVAVDGGMGDNLRPALYGAEYECLLADKAGAAPTETVTIAGRYCESGDILVRDACLPAVEPGDILAVLNTGAYHYSMANNYNRVGRPAMVLVGDGKAEIIIRRESYADMLRLDVIPNRLRVVKASHPA
jgi:diaminopimelate decarboxylase